ncbi:MULTISPECIES: hypothetical protein [unclassified Frankia]|uniref:hypothetical protein n=2 Tax=Frankia TaxID=1854 RepID=UPI001EF4FD17|nr:MULTISPECIES: hypothetical protein [unclassified Frankia]
MSRASIVARSRSLPRAEIAGIGRFTVAGRHHDFAITWDDRERAAGWHRAALAAWGFSPGDSVLITSVACEGFWTAGLTQALHDHHIVFALAESYGWDARRVGTFARRLPLAAVFGLGRETAEGLRGTASLDVLAPVRHLFARPEAFPILRGADLDPLLFAPIGPAVAVECPERGGGHVDARLWSVRAVDGQLRLSFADERPDGLRDVPLGVGGTVRTGRCACGSDDPRVLLA